MCIPAAVVDADKPHARLNEPRRQQTALTERVIGKEPSDRRRLLTDVKRAAGSRRAEDVVGALCETVQTSQQIAVLLIGAEGCVEVVAQSLAPLDLLNR